MEFIETEAVEGNQPLVFSDDEEEEKITDELDDFIDNSEQPWEDVRFYRQLELLNINDYPKFLNQTRTLLDASFEDDTLYYGTEDVQPELYALEDRESVSFNKCSGYEKSAEKFKNILKNFEDSENQFFDVMFYKSNCEIIDKNRIVEVIGEYFYNDKLKIKDEIKLDKKLFG